MELLDTTKSLWKYPPLNKWSICRMNHFRDFGQECLYISMIKNRRRITVEGIDDKELWAKLWRMAIEVEKKENEKNKKENNMSNKIGSLQGTKLSTSLLELPFPKLQISKRGNVYSMTEARIGMLVFAGEKDKSILIGTVVGGLDPIQFSDYNGSIVLSNGAYNSEE